MKRALVTGGTRGIGLAVVQKLAREGYLVTATYSACEEDAKRAQSLVPGVRFVRADAADDGETKALFEHLPALDALVCNAGVSLFRQVQDTTAEEYGRVMDVNMRGVFLAAKYAVKKMLGRGGAIVNIASVWGECGGSCESVYSASKGAVISFTKALAKELAPAGITVNCLSPGVIDTGMNARLSEEERTALEGEIPLGRFGTPEEVAEGVYYLLTARYVTGQILSVGGGFCT